MTDDISTIKPVNFRSINVFKDATTAYCGTCGTSGVIVIDTKYWQKYKSLNISNIASFMISPWLTLRNLLPDAERNVSYIILGRISLSFLPWQCP
ncbi:MAG TPA: hypothetical protein PLB07_04585 [Bacteroidales bacterium]|jgi:hypothetical protein|nr:hypothetical protein [Bacteroidales bacterium]MBK7732442.1 hypothetical protein [Bacteroidales bacterium]MBP7035404.1 hypothetical protein [Bacteroidales bacterium]MBP8710151.1 hypothetical protein [Bacteroidales bacterium]HHV00167.1 hypothetical protein [Bacteroidales bacterium]